MDIIRWLFGTKRPCGYIEGDIFYPTHVTDNTDGIRTIILSWTLCFNDVLDPGKLHGSLCRLFEIGHWRKFGGRLRIGNNRTLEVHVPPEFTTERPAVYYTHQKFNMPISEHPRASKIPKQSPGHVGLHADPNNIRIFSARPDAPSSVEDFTMQDVPVVSLHITSFDDSTLVGLSYPHVIIDAVGQGNLLRAWSLVLAGKDADVPALVDPRIDPMLEVALPGSKIPIPFIRESEQLGAWGFAKFGLRMLWDVFWEREMEMHALCLPANLVAKLRAEILNELAELTPTEREMAWVSEGDALLGLFAQKVARTMCSNGRPMNVINAADVRTRMTVMVKSAEQGLHMSGVTGIMMTLKAEEAVGPVCDLAWASRRSILEQMSEDQLGALMRLIRRQWETGTSKGPMFGLSNAFLFVVSNWTKADLFRAASFAPAVIRSGDKSETRVNGPGEMWMHQPVALRSNIFARNLLLVLGKDQSNDYWTFGSLKPAAWTMLMEAVREIEERMEADDGAANGKL